MVYVAVSSLRWPELNVRRSVCKSVQLPVTYLDLQQLALLNKTKVKMLQPKR